MGDRRVPGEDDLDKMQADCEAMAAMRRRSRAAYERKNDQAYISDIFPIQAAAGCSEQEPAAVPPIRTKPVNCYDQFILFANAEADSWERRRQ